MARLPRLAIPGQLHHVLLRGNNGQAAFLDAEDYRAFLDAVVQSAAAHRLAVHAYVLTPSAAHLLLSPADAQALPRGMQAVGRRYVRYFNDRHQRSGTIWEGRYRSSVLQPERYALPGMVWFDRLPIELGLAEAPGLYAWSSHLHFVGGRNDRWLHPLAAYWALGNTPFAREAAYGRLVEADISGAERAALTGQGPGAGWVVGDAAFVAALQSHAPRRLSKGRAGRPRSGDEAKTRRT